MEEKLIVLARNKPKAPKEGGIKAYGKMWKKKSPLEKVVLIVMTILFAVYAFTLLYPIFWALMNSFKTVEEYDLGNKFALPVEWTFDNYLAIFESAAETSDTKKNIFLSIWNSIWMSFLSTILGLIASSLTSYVVAKYKFKGSGVIYALVIFIQVIPLVGGITGMYNLLRNQLDMFDKPWAIWPIWFGGFGFSFLMLYSAFKSVPWSYAESAFIDGANHFQTFLHIMLPTVKPVLSSLFVVNFISAWNDYMTSYLYLPSYPPLALLVYQLRDDTARVSYPMYWAIVIVSIIPTIILFISFQKLIMENTTTGGLKG